MATGAYSVITDGSKVYRTTSASARAVFGDAASANVEMQASMKVASWSTATARTAGKAFTWPNYSTYLRTDGLSASIPQYYKWFSVREVAPVPAA